MKSEVYKRGANIPLAYFSRIVDAAARRKESEDQLRRTTRELRSPVAKYIEDDSGVLENLSGTVTYLSYLNTRCVVKTLK